MPNDKRWLIVWIFIYVGFLTLDIFFPGYWGSALLKYTGVFLCVVYAYKKYRNDTKLILALFLTLLADTVLVWTDMTVLGVFIFCFAQFMHFLRLTRLNKKHLGAFTLVISLLTIVSAFRGDEIIYSLAALYGGLLISNLAMSASRFHEDRQNICARCAFYGFIAFLGCDLCVGLRYVMLDGAMPADILPIIAILVWAFYYPSQVLLANSSLHKESVKGRTVAKTSDVS
ncbi:hypothetical protein IKQ38_04100 [Candidatus Saccharibacteria bacterium]|nr:hypothetical protein [Candidatus Saccharibacteria bacterium]